MAQNRTVLDDLDRQAALRPDAVAAADGQDALTFAQLQRLSDAVAAELHARGLFHVPVGVLAARRAVTVALLLGVLKSGCFYVPLDPGLRKEKLAHICADAELTLAIGCEDAPALPERVAYLHCGADFSSPADTRPLAEIRKSLQPSDAMYLIYTSGSTGAPKGVLKSHGAMVSYLDAFCREFSQRDGDVLGNQTPFSFDAAAKDVYWMLRGGCRMEILDTGLFSRPYQLIEYMNERRVSIISWVPSALCIVSQLNTFADILPKYLRMVFFIGEVFPTRQFNLWKTALPQVRFINLYGQTELAGACCFAEIGSVLPPQQPLAIGKPFSHARIVLLDDAGGQIAAPGVTGQIGVICPALADRYWNDPERTARSFVPFSLDGRTERLFLTGDLAQYDADGSLVFAARRDDQIKHMGYRIELGEIDAAAGSLPEIVECACVYDTAKSKLVLFCVTQPGVTTAQLRRAMRGVLSDYMVPSKYVILPALVRNANGKIDRPALLASLHEV